GGAHAARLLVAVERQRVEAELGTPELRAEALTQSDRLLALFPRQVVMAQRLRQSGRGDMRSIGIGLHFAKRDRPFRDAPVGVEHGVARVLPSLLQETARRAPLVFDESVAVPIAVVLDPRERRPAVRPDRLDEGEIVGTP